MKHFAQAMYASLLIVGLSVPSAIGADKCYKDADNQCIFTGGDIYDAHVKKQDIPGFEDLSDGTLARFNGLLRNTTICQGGDQYSTTEEAGGTKGGGMCGTWQLGTVKCGWQKKGSSKCGEQ